MPAAKLVPTNLRTPQLHRNPVPYPPGLHQGGIVTPTILTVRVTPVQTHGITHMRDLILLKKDILVFAYSYHDPIEACRKTITRQNRIFFKKKPGTAVTMPGKRIWRRPL
jgi:hypothetical protein